jgi:hypothetical protein
LKITIRKESKIHKYFKFQKKADTEDMLLILQRSPIEHILKLKDVKITKFAVAAYAYETKRSTYFE